MSQEQRKRCGGCECSSSGQCVKTIFENGNKMSVGCNYSDIICESCLGCKEFKKPSNWEDTHTYIAKSQEIAPPTTSSSSQKSFDTSIDVNNKEVNCSIFHNNIAKCGSYAECNYCKLMGENKCISNNAKSLLKNMGEIDNYSCYPKNYYISNSSKLNTSKGINSFDYNEYIASKIENSKKKQNSIQPTEQKDKNESSNSNGNDNPNFVFVNDSTNSLKPLRYRENNKGFYDKHTNSEITYVDEEEQEEQEEPVALVKEEQLNVNTEKNNIKSDEEDISFIEDIKSELVDNKNNTIMITVLLIVAILLFYGVLGYIFKKYN